MAIKSRYRVKNTNGIYETIHLETTADQVLITDDKQFVSSKEKNEWNNKANATHTHQASQVAFTNGKTLQQTLDNGDLKGEKGDQGDNGVYVGTLDDAPDTANIVIDDLDEGLFFEGFVPDIQIGDVFTLEPNEKATVTKRGTLETPIFDIGIPRGENTKINNTIVSDKETWSSSKIADFVLTNTDTVWTDVSGENLSIDYTKEGYLKEIEIWGNTIQNEEDLSDIQHLGELYVNEEGEPILDSQDREQYKIEIQSNDVTIYDFKLEKGRLESDGSAKTNTHNQFRSSEFVKVTHRNIYFNTFGKYEGQIQLLGYDKNKQFANLNQACGQNKIITIPDNVVYIKVSSRSMLPEGFDYTFADFNCVGTSINLDTYRQPQSNKITILLPCQLMKVGDIKDRLYWDSEKGKYVVEKNVGFSIIKSSNANPIITEGFNTVRFRHLLENVLVNKIKPIAICNRLPSKDSTIFNSDIEGITSHSSNSEINFRINKEKLESIDNIGFNKWLNDEETIVYYEAKNIELIETNITEQILLPCYKDKTHVFVNGGIDGSIKAKAPLNGGQAILSLSQENKELQEVNKTQDELINTTMLATDEVFSLLEPLLANTIDDLSNVSPLINMYVAMIQRGLKKIEDVPERYKLEISNIINSNKK